MSARSVWLVIAVLLTVLSVAIQAQSHRPISADFSSSQVRPFVDPALEQAVSQRGSANMLVYLTQRADLSPAFAMSWEERGEFVYQTLVALAESSQADLRRDLEAMGADYRAFWIENVILVRNSNRLVMENLARRNDVAALVLEPIARIPEPDRYFDPADAVRFAPATNITHIGAPDVWAMGHTGQGITVGIIDSGTRFTHQALVNQYRGNLGDDTFNHNYNWFDFDGSTAPITAGSHGTHVTGTAVGSDGGANEIGVAPGAQWVSCLGCNNFGCAGANLLACGEFMAAPTDLEGDNPNPSLRAHVVNNSWGGCQSTYDPWYQGVVDAWIAAGIVPVFASGNASNCGYPSPPGPNTVGNPARYGGVLGVGSTGNNDGLYAIHSTWGPTDNPNAGTNPALPDPMGFFDLKPNVVAPGVNICSSLATADSAYACLGWTGTSMSAPAVSGLVALMWSAAPVLIGDYATTGTIIMQTVNPVPYDSGVGGEGPGNVPNYATGWGEIDAVNAVLTAIAAAGPQGTLTGTITNQTSGLPINGAEILIINPDPPPADWRATTGENGQYQVNVATGTHDVDIKAYGYQPVTEAGVVINEDMTTILNAALLPVAFHAVSGTVSDRLTGWPLHAEIAISGFPGSPIYTDPADGSYIVMLPEGMEFDFTVSAMSGGYDFDTRTVGSLVGNQTENFTLDADPVACSAPGYGSSVSTVYMEDFESDDGAYTVSGANMDWQWGSVNGWPNGCIEGSSCWATNLGGPYTANTHTSLTSPVIDLSTASGALTLAWWQAEEIETPWHSARVEIRINGESWQEVWAAASSKQIPWREFNFDVTAAAGGSLEVRWNLASDEFQFGHFGIYVDSVQVLSAGDCQFQDGELVVGRITDANTSLGLVGATVEASGVGLMTTSTVSDDPALGVGVYYLFVPVGPQLLVASMDDYHSENHGDDFSSGVARRLDFDLTAGRVSAQPASLSKTLDMGTTDSDALILVNDGTAPAYVELIARSATVLEHFETAFPPAGWNVENLGGNCGWQRNDEVNRPNYAGGDGFSAAADSAICGSGTTMDTALVSPPFLAEDAVLDFILSYHHFESSRLDVDISTNFGDSWTTLQSYTSNVDETGPGAPQSISLAAFDGQVVLLRFRYISPGWSWWAQIDQVQVIGNADWLQLSPDFGTFSDGLTPLFTTLNVNVGYDAGTTSISVPGTYHAFIIVTNDTPYGDLEIPVEMIVEPAPGQSRIEGLVNSLGYCDTNPEELSGADVTIEGTVNTFNLSTDTDGAYGLWLDTDEAPLSITVNAGNHQQQIISGVPLISQGTTERHFSLRLDAACALLGTEALSTTLVQGGSDTLSIELINSGGAAMNWNEYVFSGPATLINQLSTGTNGIVSAYFQGLSPPTGAYSAEDFQVDAEMLTEITASGFTGSSNPDIDTFATEIAFYIYSDADGIPAGHPEDGTASAVFSYAAPPSDPAFTIINDDLSIDIPAANDGEPLRLPPGTYWVSAFASVPGTESSPRWNWFAATTASDNLARIITPGAAFDGVFPDWSPIVEVNPVYAGLALRIEGEVACGADWLSLVSDSGMIAADDSVMLAVDINASDLPIGLNQAVICIQTSDSLNGTLLVPVSLTVEPPASFGRVSGTVTSLGYCSDNPSPATGLTVTITADNLTSHDVTTDGDGYYELWLDAAEGPFSVAVAMAGHLPAEFLEIDLTAGETTTVDFDLLLEGACASVSPQQFDIQMEMGEQDSFSLFIDNTPGTVDLNWMLEKAPGQSVIQSEFPQCNQVDEVPWLGLSATSGVVNAGSEMQVLIDVDSSLAGDGSHRVWLCLSTDDDQSPQFAIPFDLQVMFNEIFMDRFEQGVE